MERKPKSPLAVLEHATLSLPARERIQLLDALHNSLATAASRRIAAACVAEVERRDAAYQRGEMGTVDGDDVMREMRRLARKSQS